MDELVYITDDDLETRRAYCAGLERAGLRVECFSTGESVLTALANRIPDCLTLDLVMPGMDGLAMLERIRTRFSQVPVIVVTSLDTATTAVTAMRLGALEYLVKPMTPEALAHTVRDAISRSRVERGDRLRSTSTSLPDEPFTQIIGGSAPMVELLQQIKRVAASEVSVAITGESGTGKELIAQSIHRASRRAGGPFVAVNCGAIPESLQDSELFGHERGAFTGASSARKGIFEQAQGGVVFLDEVAELSLATQVRLLRVLETRELVRLGGKKTVSLDVRILSATHRNLTDEVRAGRFREDLYYRLVVYPVVTPPLRERTEDIPSLVTHFLRLHAEQDGTEPTSIHPRAIEALGRYSWPGNVRELRNVLQRAAINADGGVIWVNHLPESIAQEPKPPSIPAPTPSPDQKRRDRPDSSVLALLLDRPMMGGELERVMRALDESRGNVSAAASALGIGRATLYRRLKQFGLDATEYRKTTITVPRISADEGRGTKPDQG
jgi:two-component system, NtrC family, nitrogen regulation response regulator NtrX